MILNGTLVKGLGDLAAGGSLKTVESQLEVEGLQTQLKNRVQGRGRFSADFAVRKLAEDLEE